ncbi:MAG: phosphoglucosamine mutase [Deltaproteobacteria bacterium]|nr:phosphoglucosamine mutase [Deltaproteobacteria bacterium]
MKGNGERRERLFGTDGIRGVANIEPMTAETALRVGRALAYVFRHRPGRHKILIGKDTRLSGYMLETALASGICSMGVDVLLVGPVPTPGIAFLTRSMRADAGVVISASHNPFQDNGVKVFSREGFKLPDEVEDEIESLVLDQTIDHLRPTATAIGKAFRVDDALGRYNVFVKNAFPRHLTLEGLNVVIDCAHGAAYKVAPEVLEELGARVTARGVDPDGENINRDCGALYPQHVQRLVRETGAQIGVALDGDADRVILVDETGEVIDGDVVMAIAASEMLRTGTLRQEVLVGTVMSNLGLEVALRRLGGRLLRAPVGDRYVVEEMLRGGYNLGGEQSGHVVFLDVNTTGDGLVTLLALLAIMLERQRPLSELKKVMQHYPQVLINVKVRERRDLATIDAVARTMRRVEHALGEKGRLLVRFSGTEPLVRVMVEGEDERVVRAYGEEVAEVVRKHLGADPAS